jgi:hypothetical protein
VGELQRDAGPHRRCGVREGGEGGVTVGGRTLWLCPLIPSVTSQLALDLHARRGSMFGRRQVTVIPAAASRSSFAPSVS